MYKRTSYYIEPEDLDNKSALLDFIRPQLDEAGCEMPENPRWNKVKDFMLRCREQYPNCSFELMVVGGYSEYQLLNVYASDHLGAEAVDLVEICFHWEK